MKFARTSLAIAVGLSLTACGGGGGGGGGLSSTLSPYARSNVPFYSPVSGGTYSVYASASTKTAITDIFARDLNNDNVQEVVVGGRMSQSAVAADHRDTMLQIYGWNTGSFSRETNTWFSGADNQITGTEPAVRFGDFNGDGHVDMFVAPSTDGILDANSKGYAFVNSGSSSFSRTEIDYASKVWAHDAAVSDINNDGFDDIIVVDYGSDMHVSLGGAGGFTNHKISAGSATSASSVSVSDYLGDGTKTIILTDTNTANTIDTRLYSWSIVGGELVLTKIADLPASRFYLPKWDTARAAGGVAPHEIRNISMDFDGDGRADVIVISTLPNIAGGNSNHGYTEIQFLRNDGGGTFTDVTDTVLPSFDTNTFASYQPILIDVNKDGLNDILLTARDYIGDYNSSRVLIQTADGKFTEGYGSVLTDFYNQTRNMTAGNIQGGSEGINIVQGPNGDMYLVTSVKVNDGTEIKGTVYAAKIASNGTTSAQATLAAISTAWPYLSDVSANTILAQTASSFINGIPVIDIDRIMSPVGMLGISLEGRNGKRMELNGSISVPGLDQKQLNRVSAVDDIGRHFYVNLSGLSQSYHMPVSYNLLDSKNVVDNWTSRALSDLPQQRFSDMIVNGTDQNRFATSISSKSLGIESNWVGNIGMARMPGSPWMHLSGVFGKIHSTTIMDFTLHRKWANGVFAQAGVLQTSTDLQPGLVTDISNLYAHYSTVGVRQGDWTVYAGSQPKLFAGEIQLQVPTEVDNRGVMRYSNYSVAVRNQPVYFTGIDFARNDKKNDFRFSMVTNNQGQYSMRITYGRSF